MAIGLKLRNLLFVIHAVPPERLAALLPEGLELDLRDTPDGPRAFTATVALEAGAAFPYVLSGFRQVNYRIYVRHGGEAGVLFLRSWVSSRAAAAAMSLAIPTEHASVELTIVNEPHAYSRYSVHGRSGDHFLEFEAAACEHWDLGPFASQQDAVHFLTHRLNGFTVSAAKKGLAVVRVNHAPMAPIPAQVSAGRADQWTETGLLTAEEVSRPLLALIQPAVQFDMNLPEKL
ncbi:MAG: DUF2071 domain-containing protein [Terriglobales bacterium]